MKMLIVYQVATVITGTAMEPMTTTLTIGQCIQHYNDLFYTVSTKKCNIRLRKETTGNKIA